MRFRYSIHRVHLIKSELQGVYLNMVMQSFAISLIAIFVPIYLLKMGYTLNQVILFEAVKFAGLSFFSPISALLAKRYGFKHLILYRIPMYIFYLMCIFMLEQFSLPIYLIALVGGISGSLYWVSLKSIFAMHSHKEKRGYETGKASSLPRFATIFGPAIGGIIAVAFGFRPLIVIASLLLFMSAIPLLTTKDIRPNGNSLRKAFTRENRHLFCCFIANGARGMVNGIIWPLFVFLALDNVQSVGFLATTASIGTALFMLSIGKAADRMNRHRMMKFGGLLVGITFLARYFAVNYVTIFAIAFLAEMCTGIIDIPFSTIFYDKASKGNPVDYMVLAEIGMGVGRVGVLLLMLLLVNKFLVAFLIAALAAVYYFAKY